MRRRQPRRWARVVGECEGEKGPRSSLGKTPGGHSSRGRMREIVDTVVDLSSSWCGCYVVESAGGVVAGCHCKTCIRIFLPLDRLTFVSADPIKVRAYRATHCRLAVACIDGFCATRPWRNGARCVLLAVARILQHSAPLFQLLVVSLTLSSYGRLRYYRRAPRRSDT
jgi:hypothetical protein